MSDKRPDVDAAFDERGRFVPGFVQLAAVDSFDRQLVEHDRVPIDRGTTWHNSEERDLSAVKHVRQNIVERFRIAGHFQSDVESFFHPELFHRAGEFFSAHIQREIDSHFPGELESVGIDVRDDDMSGPSMFANRDGHAANWTGAGDENILANQIE